MRSKIGNVFLLFQKIRKFWLNGTKKSRFVKNVLPKKLHRCNQIPRKRELMLSFKIFVFLSKANRGNNFFFNDMWIFCVEIFIFNSFQYQANSPIHDGMFYFFNPHGDFLVRVSFCQWSRKQSWVQFMTRPCSCYLIWLTVNTITQNDNQFIGRKGLLS